MAPERLLVTFPTYPRSEKRLSSVQIVRKVGRLQESAEDILSLVPQFTNEVSPKIDVEGPIRILPISDSHLFSMLTDYRLFEDTLHKLEDKNTFTVICGDFLEGANPGIPSHIEEVMFSTTNQVRLGKEILRPLVEKGKVLAVVGMYRGHEEWTERMTMSAIMFLVEGLKQPDGTPLQAIVNGGNLNINFGERQTYSIGLYHDAGGGGSDVINPVGDLRNRGWEEALNVPNRSNAKFRGHWHHRGAYTEENQINILTGKEEKTIYASLATYKSIDEKHPDRFLKEQAKKSNKQTWFWYGLEYRQ